jgi:hypothetical protein
MLVRLRPVYLVLWAPSSFHPCWTSDQGHGWLMRTRTWDTVPCLCVDKAPDIHGHLALARVSSALVWVSHQGPAARSRALFTPMSGLYQEPLNLCFQEKGGSSLDSRAALHPHAGPAAKILSLSHPAPPATLASGPTSVCSLTKSFLVKPFLPPSFPSASSTSRLIVPAARRNVKDRSWVWLASRECWSAELP